jgi:hypothetical protein
MKSAILALLIASTTALTARTALAQAITPTTFTYQGRLTDQGAPFNGTADLRFTLYSAATGGSAVGTPVTVTGVSVADGLLSAPVDFGRAALSTGARYVEVAVRPTGSGSYTTLTPRQAMTSAPYAATTDGILRPDQNTVTLMGQATNREYRDASSPDRSYPWYVGSDGWQSFIPGISGNLSSVQVQLFGNSSTTSATLEIRAGEGLSGSLIHSQQVSITTGQPVRIDISGVCPVVAGQQYTWRLLFLDQTNVYMYGSTSDSYSGGRSSFSQFADAYFATTVIRPGLNSAPSLTATGEHVDVAGQLTVNGAPRGASLSVSGPEWITLYSATNHTWHMNNIGGGLNFVETDIADYRLFLAPGGKVGIGTDSPQARLDVSGNIRCTSLTQTSTAAYKTEILPLPHALDTLKRLQGVAYLWNDEAPEERRGKHDIGFIAEQVDAVVPEIVAKDANGRAMGIDYGRITAIAVEAVKEQDARIASLEAQLADIRAAIATHSAKK